MERVTVSTDLSFSRMAYGFMHLVSWRLSASQCLGRIKLLLDQGITTMDHADIYGSYTCEALFGEALRLEPGLRQRMELVTKCGIQLISPQRPSTFVKHYDSTTKHVIQSVENSLMALQTDHIDVLLFHRPDPLADYADLAEAFSSLRQSGKVRYFGVSNFGVNQMHALQAHMSDMLVTNQVEASVMQLAPFQDGQFDWQHARGMVPMAWSPLAGGKVFSADSPQAVAIRTLLSSWQTDRFKGVESDTILLAWLLKHPARIVPVLGTGKDIRIQHAIHAAAVELSRQEWFQLYETALGYPVP